MNMRELMIEYIMLAFTDEELSERFYVTEDELKYLCDSDLLDIYNHTMIVDTEASSDEQ